MTKPKVKKIGDIAEALKSLLEALPSEEERHEIEKAVESATEELQEIHTRLRSLPTDEQLQELKSSIQTISSFLSKAKTNPRLALALGLVGSKKTKSTRNAVPPTESVDVGAILREFEALPTQQIEEHLLNEQQYSLRKLHEIAAALSIRPGRGTDRNGLVDKIVKLGFANRRGYALIGSHPAPASGRKIVDR